MARWWRDYIEDRETWLVDVMRWDDCWVKQRVVNISRDSKVEIERHRKGVDNGLKRLQ
jgi:hypothetical protein